MAYPGDTQLEKLFDSVHVKKALPGIMAALEIAIGIINGDAEL